MTPRTIVRIRGPFAAAALALACGGAPAHPVAPAKLSRTGLWSDVATHAVAPGNLPYAPQYPLWTDGASKRRWIHLPQGAAIDASRPDSWSFPPGTKLWKEFSFGRRVETRYMEKGGDGSWIYATYVWDDDGRDATLAPAKGIRDAAEIRPGVRHDVPSIADCRACHEGRPTAVLGFDALQLSPDRDPLAPHAGAGGPNPLDLRTLASLGLVRGLPPALLDHPPRIPASTARERAVLGYLYGNCAGCHNGTGPLASLGLALDHDLAAAAGEEPAFRTALGRESRFRIPGVAPGASRRIAPGSPDASAIATRMASRDPLVQMPPIGTHVVDDEALRLVEQWIREDLPAGGPPGEK
jgi:hypothetical protein